MDQKGSSIIMLILIIVVLAIGYWLGATYGKDTVFSLPADLGEVIEEERGVTGYSEVVLQGCGTVSIEQGEEESLKVKTKEKVMEYVKTEVRNDTLYLEYDQAWQNKICGFLNDVNVEYDLKVIDINKVKIVGLGKIAALEITTPDMEIVIEGSGDIEIPLRAENVKSTIEGSGKITLRGEAASQELRIDGNGDYSAIQLESQTAKINISGSGKAEINATDQLTVDIAGSGNVYYLGDPSIDQNISGSGKIRALK